MTELISTTQAGKLLGVSQRQAARLAENGALPAQKVANRWLVKRADVLALKERRDGVPAQINK